MTDLSNPPKSPTLLPPRKSVELEDPGAHDLENSENEDEVFSDAQEGQASSARPSSPIPTTRVEKVDHRSSYGEVPGTTAYSLRAQDAVPDELDVIPDGTERKPASTNSQANPKSTSAQFSIPKTVVEKVDPASPSHGDVPGTASHSIRKADAVPDIIRKAPENEMRPAAELHENHTSVQTPIPKTVVTKVDSHPSHGEVPGTDAYYMRQEDATPDIVEKKGDVSGKCKAARAKVSSEPMTDSVSRSNLSKPKSRKRVVEAASPIAADGGFGPMESEDSTDDSFNSDDDHVHDARKEVNEGFRENCDDIASDAEDDDFGDFDDEFQEPSVSGEEPPATQQALPLPEIPFPLLDYDELDTLDDFVEATNPYLDRIFPRTRENHPPAPSLTDSQNSLFLTDRSLSLWSQLVAPPPLQPPNWVRSRIRRLFLVSLGVPVDLDEILPASKQKKLILPSIHLRSDSPSPADGRRPGSRIRLKQDNTSSASIDQTSSHKTHRKRKGPPLPPELDLQATKMLCTTTEAALSNMTEGELQAHVLKLREMTGKASEVLEYWLKKRDSALGDKEAFEGVIENLVKHARRVRK